MKSVNFLVSAAAQWFFELLKEALVSPPGFAHSNYFSHFEVYCNTSSVGVSGVLSQKGKLICIEVFECCRSKLLDYLKGVFGCI